MARTASLEWASRVTRWKQSGLTARAFALREGIDAKQLTWWKWRFKTKGPVAPSFVPVRVRPARPVAAPVVALEASHDAAIEIVLPCGTRLRASRDLDEQTLLRVVRAVRAGCS